MTSESVVHFFPRNGTAKVNVLSILDSILTNGLRLTYEVVPVKWKDYYGQGKTRQLKIEQFRFCMSAISNSEEMRDHSQKFGQIGVEFDTEFITKLGGFPVFYVPTPKRSSNSKEDHIGVSLLYRIAEIQEILEYINDNRILESSSIDLNNAIGAIRFLANICYPTERTVNDSNVPQSYYNQREWRIIYGLESDKTQIRQRSGSYELFGYDNVPLKKFIKRILLRTTNTSMEEFITTNEVLTVLDRNNIQIEVIKI